MNWHEGIVRFVLRNVTSPSVNQGKCNLWREERGKEKREEDGRETENKIRVDE